MLLSLALVELLPHAYHEAVEALEQTGGTFYAIGFLVLGLFAIYAIGYLSDKRLGGHNHDHDEHCTHGTEGKRAGILMAVALMIHNLPEGFALGAAGAVSLRQGVLMGLMIALHNLPCGIAVCVPLVKAGVKKPWAVLAAAATGVPMVLGALLGYWLGGLNALASAAVVAMSAGVILYLTFHELFREGFAEKDRFSVLLTLLSIFLGFFLLQI